VLKNAGAKKKRWNPDGLQRGNFRKLNSRLRCGDEHRCVALLVFAGRDQRNGAFVLTGRGVWVNAFVKLGSDRKDQRQEERRKYSARDKEPDILGALFHLRRDCASCDQSAQARSPR
jgi:hypothetical protein